MLNLKKKEKFFCPLFVNAIFLNEAQTRTLSHKSNKKIESLIKVPWYSIRKEKATNKRNYTLIHLDYYPHFGWNPVIGGSSYDRDNSLFMRISPSRPNCPITLKGIGEELFPDSWNVQMQSETFTDLRWMPLGNILNAISC